MKIRILQLLLIGSMLLTACGKTTPVPEQKSITKNEVGIPEQKPITENKVDTTEKKNKQDVKTPIDKKTGIKLNEVSAVDLSKYTKNEELSLFKSPTATFILTTDSVLTDFKIQNIAYDGIKCEVIKDLYSKKTFDINMSLKVKAYIPETFSNLLISYNKDGNLYRYYVNSNMTGEGADAFLQPVKTALEAKSTDKIESNIDKPDKTERIFKIVTKNVDYKVISEKEIKTVGLGVSDNIKKILSTI
ncbi:hypothetical protein [Clostridium lacusfryxellense]|uniref:hypothetical protein n=1 Tax=Clostridium lacusfryxellense TaxID=205328 RepID=UPI001C0C3C59|nr:hypothetical protein [Clostridium lacusfryxellense]MBU3114444.1 hypothetical protein [Clostridium lacusfryxellense]